MYRFLFWLYRLFYGSWRVYDRYNDRVFDLIDCSPLNSK